MVTAITTRIGHNSRACASRLAIKIDYSNSSDFQKCVETIRAIGGDGKLCKCLNGIHVVQEFPELDAVHVRNAVETHALQVVKLKIERAACCLPPLSARVINRQSMDGPAIKKYTKAEACLEAQKHISATVRLYMLQQRHNM